jgi:PAS domain S-box-containing protein
MKKLSNDDFDQQLNKIIGLGETSTRKSYYPELQQGIVELDLKNKELLKEIEARKQIQKELVKSEALYRTLAQNITEGVLISSSQGKLIYVNPALESILKRSKEELLGMELMEIFHKNHHGNLDNLIKHYRNTHTQKGFTSLCIRGDDKKIWLKGNYQIIQWQGKEAALVTAMDATQQVENEKIANELQQENLLLKSKNMHRYGLGPLVGTSEKMQVVYEKIVKAASIEANVVVYGESGTGKELVARSIHDLSNRNKMPYIAVNCGAIPENLFESEFFGHKKGAFSGANMDKVGFFESADKGTLFLDEIGEIPLNLQVKLLRAIEGSGYTPVGSTRTRQSDVRIIAATNQDLTALTEKGIIREDFFYRIHIVPVYLPPLKEREEDIPLLTYHFTQKMGGPEKNIFIPDAIIKKFQKHSWPGNVRELQNAVSRYLAFNTIDFTENLSQQADPLVGQSDVEEASLGEIDLNSWVNRYEKQLIKKALLATKGNISRAADLLKIGRRSLQRKITRLDIH